MLSNKRQSSSLKLLSNFKDFIELLNDFGDIYKNIEEYNTKRKRKIMIIFHDIIAFILSNKTLNPIVTELFIRYTKLNIFLVFMTKSYFAAPKSIRLNSLYYENY